MGGVYNTKFGVLENLKEDQEINVDGLGLSNTLFAQLAANKKYDRERELDRELVITRYVYNREMSETTKSSGRECLVSTQQ